MSFIYCLPFQKKNHLAPSRNLLSLSKQTESASLLYLGYYYLPNPKVWGKGRWCFAHFERLWPRIYEKGDQFYIPEMGDIIIPTSTKCDLFLGRTIGMCTDVLEMRRLIDLAVTLTLRFQKEKSFR